jgi:hypothetical protein
MNYPNIPQSIALQIKFCGATNSKGARVEVSCQRLGANKSFPYDYSARGAYGQIESALVSAGILPACLLDMGKHYILVIPWSFYEEVLTFMGK